MQPNLLSELDCLISEGRNPVTSEIDKMSSAELVACMNVEDAKVAGAVTAVLADVAHAVDAITAAFRAGGRLIYIGAGTSGRLGVLDASECPPTFGVPEGMVIGLVAGGDAALRTASEGAEDDPAEGAAALDGVGVSSKDVVVGLAVSGRTPFVVGALHHAGRLGAATVAVSCNPGSPVACAADISIAPVVGPEVLTGSTRLKSGTAQKMILNMLSTASMIRLGKAYGNLMVDLHASNEKLVARALRVVMQATGSSEQAARDALARSGQDVKLAILVLKTNEGVEAARSRLDGAGGVLRLALDRDTSNHRNDQHTNGR